MGLDVKPTLNVNEPGESNESNETHEPDKQSDPDKPNELSIPMTPDTPDTRAAEFAALVALDAIEDDRRVLAERDSDPVTLHEFHRVTAVLADAASQVPPLDLRDQVLSAARARRTPGTLLHPVEPTSPGNAFRRTVDELHELLVDLDEAEWSRSTLEKYGDVHDLVAHLTGVEESLLGILGEGSAPDPGVWNNHVEATASFVRELRRSPTGVLTQRWFQSAKRLASVAEETERVSPDRIVPVNDVPVGANGMLVLRTFEVWTHHEDICRATGRPFPSLDAGRLRRMSGDLIAVLPVALSLMEQSRPGRTARLVLTGAGGGTFDIPMAPDSPVGPPDVRIVADVVDFCRLAARRTGPAALSATIEGDGEQLADLILVAAGAFARD